MPGAPAPTETCWNDLAEKDLDVDFKQFESQFCLQLAKTEEKEGKMKVFCMEVCEVFH